MSLPLSSSFVPSSSRAVAGIRPDHSRVVNFFAALPSVAALIAVAVGVLSAANWRYEWMPVKTPATIMMRPWSAALFVLLGLGLWSLATQQRRAIYVLRVVATVLGGIAMLVALLHAVAWAGDRDLGLDLWFAPDTRKMASWAIAGSISISSTIAFLFASGGVLALPLDERDGGHSAHWFALGALIVSFLNLVGFAFGVPYDYALSGTHGMALMTAITMFVLASGILFARPNYGFASVMVDLGPAGSVVRRLVPSAVAVPFLLGLLLVYTVRAGRLQAPLGISIYVVVTIAILIWVAHWAARIARETDRVRELMLATEQDARETAEAANESKSNFLAVMSHELRTPLSAVIGYQELLADGIAGPVNDAQKQQLSRIKSSAQHLLELIDQILAYSRIEAGREEIRIETVSANRIAADAANLVEPLARSSDLDFEVVPMVDDVDIQTDAGKVRQILVNLLFNAVKFTAKGKITLVVRTVGTTIHYEVHDTGIGVAPEHLEHIFDAFWQVERPSTRRIGGTGLGLSVTRRLVDLLGGSVNVKSTVGVGTTFIIVLPIVSERAVVAS